MSEVTFRAELGVDYRAVEIISADLVKSR